MGTRYGCMSMYVVVSLLRRAIRSIWRKSTEPGRWASFDYPSSHSWRWLIISVESTTSRTSWCSGATTNSSFMTRKALKQAAKKSSCRWRSLLQAVQTLPCSRNVFTRYGTHDAGLARSRRLNDDVWMMTLSTGIASRWINSIEQSNALKKSFSMNVILGMVNCLPSRYSWTDSDLLSSRCSAIHEIWCTADCSDGKISVCWSTTAIATAEVKGWGTHWRNISRSWCVGASHSNEVYPKVLHTNWRFVISLLVSICTWPTLSC